MLTAATADKKKSERSGDSKKLQVSSCRHKNTAASAAYDIRHLQRSLYTLILDRELLAAVTVRKEGIALKFIVRHLGRDYLFSAVWALQLSSAD